MFRKTHPDTPPVVHTSTLKRLRPDEVVPSKNNPRLLFDDEPMQQLRESIRVHGVLVPITVYLPKGSEKYFILDGARRHHCCEVLIADIPDITIPAHVVDPPDKVAGLIYMFSIHQLREQWELMPSALSLGTIMDELDERDTKALSKLTGMSSAQIERCKLLLGIPERFQQMSLIADPVERIPANLWIEALPVIELIERELPDLAKRLGREGIFEKFYEKYKAGKIKSVIHFRKIMEAYEVGNNVPINPRAELELLSREDEDIRKTDVLSTLQEYVENVNLETRQAFDGYVVESRQIQGAVEACSDFKRQLERLKLDYVVEKDSIVESLKAIHDYVEVLLQKLEGGDAPTEEMPADGVEV